MPRGRRRRGRRAARRAPTTRRRRARSRPAAPAAGRCPRTSRGRAENGWVDPRIARATWSPPARALSQCGIAIRPNRECGNAAVSPHAHTPSRPSTASRSSVSTVGPAPSSPGSVEATPAAVTMTSAAMRPCVEDSMMCEPPGTGTIRSRTLPPANSTPSVSSTRLASSPTARCSRLSGSSSRSNSVTRWDADSVAAVSVPISPAPMTATRRPGRSRRGSSSSSPAGSAFWWATPIPGMGGLVARRPVAQTSSSNASSWSSPRAQTWTPSRRRSRSRSTAQPSRWRMPAAARPSAVARYGAAPRTRARFESGGRSQGSPGPISVTGTPLSARRRAHAYPATPFPTTVTCPAALTARSPRSRAPRGPAAARATARAERRAAAARSSGTRRRRRRSRRTSRRRRARTPSASPSRR